VVKTAILIFHTRTVHPDIIKFFIYPTECTTRLFYIKAYIKIYIKMILHVSVNKSSSGSLLLCFAKVMVIKTVSYNTSL